MGRFILDTNIVTGILRRDVRVISRLEGASRTNAEIYLCPVVYYEVRRGLLAKQALRQLQEFEDLSGGLLWADFERPMWEDAAEMYAECRRRGEPHDDDADLLIAAYARHCGATLVTNNTTDFLNLGVQLDNWVG